jgi:hypothetical protein
MKLLTNGSKFPKKIDTLCDSNFKVVLLFTVFSLKITSFSIYQSLIPLFCEIFPINKRAGDDHSGSPGV